MHLKVFTGPLDVTFNISTATSSSVKLLIYMPENGSTDALQITLSTEQSERVFYVNTTLRNITNLRSYEPHMFTISNLTGGQEYIVTIATGYLNVFGTQNMTLNFTTEPLPVRNLTIVHFETTSIQLAWCYPLSGYWDAFKISYFNEIQETLIVNANVTNITISNLMPGTVFVFNVTSLRRNLSSHIQSIIIETRPLVADCMLTGISNHGFNIIIQPPVQGSVQSYQIFWRSLNTSISNTTTLFSENRTDHFYLDRLNPGAFYEVSILSESNDAVALENCSFINNTVPYPVGNLTVNESMTSTTSLAITWLSPVATYFDSYIVMYAHNQTLLSHDINSTYQVETIFGLVPGEFYNISVSSLSGQTRSLPEYVQGYTIPDSPDHIMVTNNANNNVTITVIYNGLGEIKSYELAITSQNQPTTSFDSIITFPFKNNATSITVKTLLPGLGYTFQVKSLSGSLTASTSLNITAYTDKLTKHISSHVILFTI